MDSFTLQPGRKLGKTALALETMTYQELSRQGPFVKYKQPQSTSQAQVFRTSVLDRDSSTLITVGTFDPTVEGRMPETRGWWDLDERGAREAVLAGSSIYVGGLPGTGQSHTVMGWIRGSTRKVYLTAPTHVAARNVQVEVLEPMTLHRF